MTDNQGANREYRDRLFKYIFGNPENKGWTLILYNAMSGTNYANPDDIHFNTIGDAVFMGMKNDVSFLVGNAIHFYEQQSTYDKNMPLRFFIYSAMAYEGYMEENKDFHRYRSSLQKIPRPKCVCFYNGPDDEEDRRVLKLSDAFMDGPEDGGDIEVKVLMININYGHNKELHDKCEPLKEYSWFVARVQENLKTTDSLKEAIVAAIHAMPDDFVIKHFLLLHEAEVTHMYITEYDQDRALAEWKEEGREEGREEGGLKMLAGLVKKGILTLSQAVEQAQMTEPEFKARVAALGETL